MDFQGKIARLRRQLEQLEDAAARMEDIRAEASKRGLKVVKVYDHDSTSLSASNYYPERGYYVVVPEDLTPSEEGVFVLTTKSGHEVYASYQSYVEEQAPFPAFGFGNSQEEALYEADRRGFDTIGTIRRIDWENN